MQLCVDYFNSHATAVYLPIVYFGERDEAQFQSWALMGTLPYCIISFAEVDWNSAFTPWPYRNYSGQGLETLKAIDNFLESLNVPLRKQRMALGYSLGGLMALWAGSKNSAYRYIGCCSGSLWYPEFEEELSTKQIWNRTFYFSLGDKESHCRHPLMKTVEEKTLRMTENLKKKNRLVYEINPGNHFNEIEQRLLKGFRMLMNQYEQNQKELTQLCETKTASTSVYSGSLLNIYRDTVALPNGGSATREYNRHPGAVAIVAMDEQNRIVMERQFRYPLNQVISEIPAGKLNFPEEDPLSAAKRELREETGITADHWQHLIDFVPTCAYSDEVIHLFLARGLHQGERDLDEDEFLNCSLRPLDELLNEIQSGQIIDGKTQTALLYTRCFIRNE